MDERDVAVDRDANRVAVMDERQEARLHGLLEDGRLGPIDLRERLEGDLAIARDEQRRADVPVLDVYADDLGHAVARQSVRKYTILPPGLAMR
jgi:hypothetical protein